MFCWLFFLKIIDKSTLKGLSKAVDDVKTIVEGEFCFWDNKVVSFLENGSSFRMSQNGPFESDILQMFGRNFTSVGSISEVGRILSWYFNIFVGVELLNQRDVEWDWSDDNVYV